MGEYEVIRECYVPVGSGLKYKRPGNVVTLNDEDASHLASYIKPLETQQNDSEQDDEAEHDKPKRKRVAKRNTPVEQPAVEPELFDLTGEVTPDAGDQGSGDERADAPSS